MNRHLVVTRTVRSAKPGCRSHGNSHTVELPLGGLLRQRTLIAHLPEHTLALSPNRPSFAVGRRMWGYDSDQVLAPRDQRPSTQETLIVFLRPWLGTGHLNVMCEPLLTILSTRMQRERTIPPYS